MIGIRHESPAPRRAFQLKAGLVLLGVLMFVLAGAYPANAQGTFPKIITLPDGFRPEGIATGRGTDFYVGSLADGAIYKGDLRTGEGEILAEGVPGRAITGVKIDKRTNYIFAAGQMSGMAFVFDSSGDELAAYQLTARTPTFINDIAITNDAVYFTDSNQPYIYELPLGKGGQLLDAPVIEEIPLTGDYVHQAGFNANGIVATPNGKTLIIVQSSTGFLFSVDPKTGVARQIDLGGATVVNGDGLLLEGKTLYVMQNRLNQISVIDLDLKKLTGRVVDTITDPAFDVPATIAMFGSRIYAVNARFTTQPTPDTGYTVVQVSK